MPNLSQYQTSSGERAWRVTWRDSAGRRRSKQGFRSARAAQTFSATVAELPPAGADLRLRDVVPVYVRSQIAAGARPSSYGYLDRWTAELGRYRLLELDADLVERVLDAWSVERPVSPATRNRRLAQLSGVLSWSVRRRYLRAHPLRGAIGRALEDNARERWLRVEELRRVEANCDPWLRDVVRFAASTGMRLGEIVDLRVAAILHDELGRSWIVTERTKNRRRRHWPLEAYVLELVERRLDELGDRRDDPDARVFAGPRGGDARSSIVRGFRNAVRAAGLEYGRTRRGITFHTLRHTFASLAINRGVAPETVQELGNWRDVRMLKRYSHLADERLRAGARAVAELVAAPDRLFK